MRRQSVVFWIISGAFILITARLFYWQVIKGTELAQAANQQYFNTVPLFASRGEIHTNDDYQLVSNKNAYLIYGEPEFIEDKSIFAETVSLILGWEKDNIYQSIIKDNLRWVPLAHKIEEDKYQRLKFLSLKGLGFEKEDTRFYPEASMSAHILGFVGSDEFGNAKGYFGLEGYYNRALMGNPGQIIQEKDARGKPILVGGVKRIPAHDGQSLELHLDRSIQFILENALVKGLEKYGAKAGLVSVINPKSGGILGSAALPSYMLDHYSDYDNQLYANPLIAQLYEPGSTFKTIVMSAALNEHAVDPKTVYKEDGPVDIGEYTIHTWNGEYHGELTATEILEKSSNPGMVFIGKKLGDKKLLKYLVNFGFGSTTGIDLEEEEVALFRPESDWKEIDYATASFGQGIAVTPIQMLTAIATLANGGKLMEPHVVKNILDPSGKKIEIKPKIIREVIRPSTARIITEMMISAVDKGEARWAKPPGYRIAGKTGTAQIPVAGHYDADKTIASFVGFAPADDPHFAMLVLLWEPTSSPWGSETAAPLFFEIAKEFFAYYGLSPKS